VNGLVILNEEQQLSSYYWERVIGGEGAFVLQVADYEDFARAMRIIVRSRLKIPAQAPIVSKIAPIRALTAVNVLPRSLTSGRRMSVPGTSATWRGTRPKTAFSLKADMGALVRTGPFMSSRPSPFMSSRPSSLSAIIQWILEGQDYEQMG
jgi:hypothetical protein